jgi:hypothetical protein
MRAMADSRIEKWLRWLENEIQPEVMTMNLHRHVWQEVGEIIEANGSLGESYWFEFSSHTYATTQAIAIRRQADTSPRVIALGRLLTEIADNAELLTRAWWIGLWTNPDMVDHGIATAGFTKQFAPDGGEHLDPAVPAADLAELTRVAEAVKRYVDQHVAHNDAMPIPGLPTYKDLDDNIDLIGKLFAKYANLLTAAVWPILVPAIQHNWKAIFTQPWIK